MSVSLAIVMATGCSSPREPFAQRIARPTEQCLSDAILVAPEDAQIAFDDEKLLRYEVKRGDTLWGISRRFLAKPWYWKLLWYNNPQVHNPHKIYPGDVLSIMLVNGEKRIAIVEANPIYHGADTGRYTKDGRKIFKYKPQIREYPINESPITIFGSVISPFLLNTELFMPEYIQSLPKVFGDAGDYLSISNKQTIFARRLPSGVREFSIYRIGNPVTDSFVSASGRVDKLHLGHQMNYVGKAEVVDEDIENQLFRLRPSDIVQPILEGDVLVPRKAEEEVDYFPRLPSPICNRGYMLGNTNTQTLSVKEFDVVTTSFGQDNQAQIGDIWKIVRPGPVRTIDEQRIQIPPKEIGYLMIIKVYDRYSLGFVLDSSQNIDLNDWLVRP